MAHLLFFLMDINNNTLADLKHSFDSLKSFWIVLKEWKSKTIALYLNPQLKNKVFLRYSFLHGLEGIEERGASVFAFSHGKFFKVRLHVEVEQEKKKSLGKKGNKWLIKNYSKIFFKKGKINLNALLQHR